MDTNIDTYQSEYPVSNAAYASRGWLGRSFSVGEPVGPISPKSASNVASRMDRMWDGITDVVLNSEKHSAHGPADKIDQLTSASSRKVKEIGCGKAILKKETPGAKCEGDLIFSHIEVIDEMAGALVGLSSSSSGLISI